METVRIPMTAKMIKNILVLEIRRVEVELLNVFCDEVFKLQKWQPIALRHCSILTPIVLRFVGLNYEINYTKSSN